MARTAHVPVTVIAAAALLFVACNGAAPPPAQPAEEPVAHDFTLLDLDGESKHLADWAGQVLLIDFWATWCAPCREEIPWLKELQETYGDEGFTLIAISDENAEIVRKFVEEREITYVNLVDPGEATRDYGVVSLPTAFLVDREGNIVEEFRGVKPQRILEAKLREQLGLPPAT
jgi:peroxiredoxin